MTKMMEMQHNQLANMAMIPSSNPPNADPSENKLISKTNGDEIIKSVSTNQYYTNYQVSPFWKSRGGARRFFMPLPNRRFHLMHHHEIEQVLRKQLSHMMLPDPLNADFYCGVTQAREGKRWEGFGVPGLNHVYVAKSNKYPKHLDGSPILPPGTLG